LAYRLTTSLLLVDEAQVETCMSQAVNADYLSVLIGGNRNCIEEETGMGLTPTSALGRELAQFLHLFIWLMQLA
jgi:hypothetical protein